MNTTSDGLPDLAELSERLVAAGYQPGVTARENEAEGTWEIEPTDQTVPDDELDRLVNLTRRTPNAQIPRVTPSNRSGR